MDAQRTKVHLVNAALIELGMPPSYSTDDFSSFGSIIDVQYPRCIARCFGLHDWSFCRRTRKLVKAADIPQTGFNASFEMPGDRIGPPLKLLINPRSPEPMRNYRIEGNFVDCDATDLYGEFKVSLDPRDWDDQFADVFCVALASMLAIPVKQDDALSNQLKINAFGTNQEGLTGGLFGRLIAQHMSGAPVGAGFYNNDPLTAAHGGGSWHGG